MASEVFPWSDTDVISGVFCTRDVRLVAIGGEDPSQRLRVHASWRR